MSYLQRRHLELSEKLDGIYEEFSHWCELSETKAFEKHRSQIVRTTDALGAFAGAARESLDELTSNGSTPLGRAQALERTILDLHRLWDFYRSKLALRRVDWYRCSLTAADELTWACYSGVQHEATAARGGQLKEPPLVFLNGALSPFAVSRGEVYEPERVPGEPLGSSLAASHLRRLPISVVGVPWFQLWHVPSTPVLCHEVGHNIEEDFGLSAPLAAVLERNLEHASVPETRCVKWRGWMGEVFGDVVGCAGAGSAFGSALMDFLAANESPHVDPRYPSSAVRAQIVLETLRVMQGGNYEANALEKRWRRDYLRVAEPASEHAADVPAVVQGLGATKLDELGGKSLLEIVSFSSEEETAAAADADRLLKGTQPETMDTRLLHAAARKAFDKNPASYVKDAVGQTALAWIHMAQRTGPRALVAGHGASEKELKQADAALGRELFALGEATYQKGAEG